MGKGELSAVYGGGGKLFRSEGVEVCWCKFDEKRNSTSIMEAIILVLFLSLDGSTYLSITYNKWRNYLTGFFFYS